MFIHFLLSRLLSALLVIFGVILIVFLLIHLVPGDPIEVMLGDSPTMADREQLRQSLGLDQPILTQFFQYFNRLLHFDLGESIHSGRKISEILFPRIWPTVYLTLASLFVAIVIAFPLGIMSALNKNTMIDKMAMGISLIGISIPNFLMGPLLILIFSILLGILPVNGNDSISSIVLPALTLGTALAAILSRMIRASLLETMTMDYVRTAKAKGLSKYQIIYKHTLRNALLPVVTIIGLQFGALLGGAVITEMIFSWPGLGQLTIESIQKRDYPVVQACMLLITTTYVLVNTLTDLAYAALDPRIRLDAKS
ncbi:MAG: ABC transporter permease [Gammaproteobacteria bacterium]|nr:ABC transporter permease [Gammaproteobacteria bacterium]